MLSNVQENLLPIQSMLLKLPVNDYRRPMKPSKFQTFGLGQTIWADKFWGIWGIFDRFISTHFGTLSSLFSINQPLYLQKTKPFISKSQIFIWGWDLNLGRKELGF